MARSFRYDRDDAADRRETLEAKRERFADRRTAAAHSPRMAGVASLDAEAGSRGRVRFNGLRGE